MFSLLFLSCFSKITFLGPYALPLLPDSDEEFFLTLIAAFNTFMIQKSKIFITIVCTISNYSFYNIFPLLYLLSVLLVCCQSCISSLVTSFRQSSFSLCQQQNMYFQIAFPYVSFMRQPFTTRL